MTYVFVRYAPAVHEGVMCLRLHQPRQSTTVCRVWSVYTWTFMELLIMAVELILVVRVCVLYKTNTLCFKTFCGVFACESVTMIALMAFSIPKQLYSPHCLSVYSPQRFGAYWLASLVFESVIWGLTIAKFLRSGIQYLPAHGRRSYIYLIMRDGTWAFAVIFLTMLTSTLTFHLTSSARSGIAYHLVIGVLSSSGSRVILNIRRFATPEHNISDDDSVVPLDSVHLTPSEVLNASPTQA